MEKYHTCSSNERREELCPELRPSWCCETNPTAIGKQTAVYAAKSRALSVSCRKDRLKRCKIRLSKVKEMTSPQWIFGGGGRLARDFCERSHSSFSH
jgi:hypothetical protein